MGDIIIGIVLLLVSILVYATSGDFPSFGEAHLSAASFPRLIVLFLGALSLLLIVLKSKSLYRKSAQDRYAFKEELRIHLIEHKLVYLTISFFFLYVASMRYVGFRMATFVFVLATSLLLSPRTKTDIIIAAILALVVTLGPYYFFQNVLYVRFPRGIF